MSGKIAFISNVSQYVGPPAGAELTANGWEVFCHDDTFASADARAEFEKEKPGCHASAQTDVSAFVEEGLSRFGKIDALISNDIPKNSQPLSDKKDTLGNFESLVDSLLLEPVRMLRAALPAMKSAETGSIVLVTSGAPLRNPAMGRGIHGYTAARGGANILVKALALELAPLGIPVNAIAPYFVYNNTFFPSDIGMDDPKFAPMLEKFIPMKRFGSQEEMGKLVYLLAAGEAKFISGQIIAFSGAAC